MSRALYGWAGEFMSVCYARSCVQGKVQPHYEAQELNQKAALQQGPAGVPGGGQGRFDEPGTRGRATGDTRPLLSVGQAKVWQRTTLKRTRALPCRIKKQFPTKLPFSKMLSRV